MHENYDEEKLILIGMILLFLFTSCLSTEIALLPNSHLESVSKEVADQDMEQCQKKAIEDKPYPTPWYFPVVWALVSTGFGSEVENGPGYGGRNRFGGKAIIAGAAFGVVSGTVMAIFFARDTVLERKRLTVICLEQRGYRVSP